MSANTYTQARSLRRNIQGLLMVLENPSRDRVSDTLAALGWRELGSGQFTVVFAHPEYPEVVVKVGQRKAASSWCNYIDAFPEFVAWGKSVRTRSKFMPKVYWLEHLSDIAGGVYVAIIERCKAVARDLAQGVTEASTFVRTGSQYGTIDRHAVRFMQRIKHLGFLDVHGANVMARPDGSLVLTDPLVVPA